MQSEYLLTQARDLLSRGSVGDALRLASDHWLDLWFGSSPRQLRALLDSFSPVALAQHPALLFLARLVGASGAHLTDKISPDELATPMTDLDSLMVRSMGMVELRHSGQNQRALAITDDTTRSLAAHENAMHDVTAGLAPLFYLQAGTTAMLAGDPIRAEAWLRRAEIGETERFAFVRREALAKRALVEAVCGEPPAARELLERADAAPRTESWTERSIDATTTIVRVLLALDEGRAPEPASLDTLLSNAGEMWPFALWATVRAGVHAADYDAVLRTLSVTEAMNLPGANGDGVGAAITPLTRATVLLRQRRMAEARSQATLAPATLPHTQLILARIALVSGDPLRALSHARAGEQSSAGFPRIAFQLSSAIVSAKIGAGELEAATEAALALVALAEQVPAAVRATAPSNIMKHAREAWSDDAMLAQIGRWDAGEAYLVHTLGVPLTPRENEIVVAMARDLSAAEIAKSLFITDNTLKTHTKNLYRKLKVSGRSEALAEARRRRII